MMALTLQEEQFFNLPLISERENPLVTVKNDMSNRTSVEPVLYLSTIFNGRKNYYQRYHTYFTLL